LTEALAREGGAQLEGRDELFEATRDIVGSSRILVGKNLGAMSQ
jgi:hypothetical protein